MKRALISVAAGAALLFSSGVYAASTPLAPGGAAGVKQAQEWNRIPVWGYVGGVLVIVGFVAVIANNGGGKTKTGDCDPSTGSCGGGGSSTGSTGTN